MKSCTKMAGAVFLLAAIPVAAAQNLPSQPKADVIFLHGNIYTGVADTSSFHADPARRSHGRSGWSRRRRRQGRRNPEAERARHRGHRSGRALCDARIQRCSRASGRTRVFSGSTVELVGVKSLDRVSRSHSRARAELPDRANGLSAAAGTRLCGR